MRYYTAAVLFRNPFAADEHEPVFSEEYELVACSAEFAEREALYLALDDMNVAHTERNRWIYECDPDVVVTDRGPAPPEGP